MIGALLWTGVIPWRGSSASDAIPFHVAEAGALAAVRADLGGTWSALGGLGFDERNATVVPAATLATFLGPNCSATPVPGGPVSPVLVIPSFAGSFASGLAPSWVVLVSSGDAGSLVVVQVLNRSAQPVAEVGGSNCGLGGPGGQPLPSGTLDSPSIAGTAWEGWGSSWVKVEPSLTSLTLAAFGSGTYSGVSGAGVWGILYSACNPLLGGPLNEVAFFATFNLTTGQFTDSSSLTLGCPS